MYRCPANPNVTDRRSAPTPLIPEDFPPNKGWNQVYLAVPVQGHRQNDVLYLRLAEAIRNAGARIVNPGVVRNPPVDLDNQYAATAIFKENLKRLRSADILIAELSSPSLGTGYEIAVAERLNLPIVGLWCSEDNKLSKMVLGNEGSNLHLFEYVSVEDLDCLVSVVLAWSSEIHRIEQCDFEEQDRVKKHFCNLASDYDITTQWRRNERLADWFGDRIPKGTTCLDVGSGTGLSVIRAADEAGQIVRIDLSTAMLRQRVFGHCVTASADKLPFGTGTIDTGVIRQVLHYVDEGGVLGELRRVLRRSGTLLVGQVIAPDDRTCRWWLELKRMVQPLRRTFFTRPGLKKMLVDSGFALREEKTLYLWRSDPWNRFVTNVPTPAGEKLVRSYLEIVPSDVEERLQLEVTDDTVSYRQNWYLAACVPA